MELLDKIFQDANVNCFGKDYHVWAILEYFYYITHANFNTTSELYDIWDKPLYLRRMQTLQFHSWNLERSILQK